MHKVLMGSPLHKTDHGGSSRPAWATWDETLSPKGMEVDNYSNRTLIEQTPVGLVFYFEM